MKKYFELVIFLFSSFTGIAQRNLCPVFEIKTITATPIFFNDSNRQMPANKTRKLAISQLSNRFRSNVDKN
jgi:hypothetical protein